MEGYIIWDVTCTRQLTRDLIWYDRDIDLKGYGYVFTDVGVSYVKGVGHKWEIQPAYKQKASWNEKDGMKIAGNLEPLYDIYNMKTNSKKLWKIITSDKYSMPFYVFAENIFHEYNYQVNEHSVIADGVTIIVPDYLAFQEVNNINE